MPRRVFECVVSGRESEFVGRLDWHLRPTRCGDRVSTPHPTIRSSDGEACEEFCFAPPRVGSHASVFELHWATSIRRIVVKKPCHPKCFRVKAVQFGRLLLFAKVVLVYSGGLKGGAVVFYRVEGGQRNVQTVRVWEFEKRKICPPFHGEA